MAKIRPTLNETIKQRAHVLGEAGIKPLDALHLACAEEAGADYFLSRDDRLLRRYSGNLLAMNPLAFISSLGAKS